VKLDSSALTARIIGIAALVVLAVCGLAYIFSAAPPYGFYYDLGANIVATSLISNWMRGFADVWDAFGWAGWGERTAFTYAPMTGYVFAVPIAKMLGGNAIAAVKSMQVFDLAAAWASGAYLYVTLRGRTPWAWVAGLVYAILPYEILMIRGNFEFGLVSAFVPLLLALPVVLLRRFGLAALPIFGAIAGMLSTNVVVEYAIFVGVPVTLAAIASAYDRARRGLWFCAGGATLLAFVAVSAYTAIPTFASHALFAAPASVDALLQGGEFNTFAESPAALIALLLNETIADQRAEFSIAPQMWLLIPLGFLLWALAIGWVVRCVRSRSFAPGERAIVICAAACTLISMGSVIPGVGIVWWVIAHLPGISMVRTPDRFIALAVPVVVMCAVSSLEYLSRSVRARAFAFAALAAIVGSTFAIFFVLRIFLGDTYSVEEKMPDLDKINAVAEARGNRAVNLALVDNGSIFDTSLYGMSVPNIDFASDFTERYEGDGLGGTGMLARANIATVIASPPWTGDSPLIAQSSIARAAFLHPVAGDATSVAAYGVDPVRGFVHPVEPACIDGGPGMLDYLEVLPAFATTAFVPNGRDCRRTLYTDSAPAEAVLGGAIAASLPGVQLFANSGILRDIDYRIALGRFFLAVPWYRNAIDGDSPQIGTGAVSLDPGNTGSAPFMLATAGDYSVAIRAVCHGTISGRVKIDEGAEKPMVCAAGPGFTWIKIPVGHLSAGAHRLSMTVDAIDTNSPAAKTTWHFGVDGAVLVASGVSPAAAPASSRAFAFSASRLTTIEPPGSAGTLALVGTHGFDSIAEATGSARVQLMARAPDATASYRFSGTPGLYRISAAAYVDAAVSGESYLGIQTGAHCCLAITSFVRESGSQVYVQGDRFLRPGDLVAIVLHTTANDPRAIAQLMSVSAEPDPKPVTADDTRSHYGAIFDFPVLSSEHNPQVPRGPTPVPGRVAMSPFYGIQLWPRPTTLSAGPFPAETRDRPTSFATTIVGAGSALVRFSCGDAVTTLRMGQPGGEVTVAPSSASTCSAQITTNDPGLYLRSASIRRAIAKLDLAGSRWIAAGTYRVAAIGRGTGAAPGTVSLDGRPVRGFVTIARSGMHGVRWNAAPADAFMLTFVPLAWSPALAPIIVRQDSGQRWSIHLDRTSSLEGAVLSDGHWQLTGAGGVGSVFAGSSCDLSNTCFANVPPGDYRLWHAWPGYIYIGFAITLLAWVGAGGLLVLSARRKA
jgi:hypothetical protein